MTPLDERITAAWRTGLPPELHRAAEQLAAQGHDESAIYDALERLLLEARAAGADDEVEERITNVMDRLTGWCRAVNHIKTTRATPTDGTANGTPTENPRWSAPK